MKPTQLTGLSLAGLLCCSASLAQLTVTVPEPQAIFKPLAPVVWDTEPSIPGEEIALAQELGALVRQQDYRGALALLESQETPVSAAFEMLRAQLYSTLDERGAAIEAYRAALKLAPDFTRAHAGLGTLYLIEGQYDEAQQHLADAVRLGAGDAQTFGQLGYLNIKLGNPWGAVSGYQQALLLQPKNRQWRSGLLLALTESGNESGASALIDQMLTENPSDSMLWQQRANLALRQDDPLSALASLEVSLRLGDDSAENRQVAAQLAVQAGNPKRGAALASASVLASSADVSFVSELADWLLRAGEQRYAKQILDAMEQRLSNYRPDQQSRFYYIRGRLAEQSDQPRQAIADYRRSVDRDGSNGPALLALGELSLSQGQASRAALAFQRASVLTEFRQQAMVGEAKSLIARSDYPAALRKLQDTLNEFPGAYDLNGAIQSLSNIVNTQRAAAP
ncbi:MAG: tetratricopeptide repeat protein [Pseudomonadota bacterium]